MKLVIKRILAFFIDYLVGVVYALLLYIVSISFFDSNELNENVSYDPVLGQLIGFFSLTLPVFLYSFLTENSNWRSTLGKKLQKLIVESHTVNRFEAILKRNILKYLPWEIAHTGIHWLFYFDSINAQTPTWVWLLLILPQVTIIFYMAGILVKHGKQSLYDIIAKTKIAYSPV